jgi:hypothetical protein
MTSYHIELPVLLQLEIEADDADTAMRFVDAVFKLPEPLDPLMGANIRSSPALRRGLFALGHVTNAKAQGPARLIGSTNNDAGS